MIDGNVRWTFEDKYLSSWKLDKGNKASSVTCVCSKFSRSCLRFCWAVRCVVRLDEIILEMTILDSAVRVDQITKGRGRRRKTIRETIRKDLEIS